MNDLDAIWNVLEDVKDPEIPIISLVEMGILRDVRLDADGSILITVTPTFSGCPALEVMKQDIVDRLSGIGIQSVRIMTVYSPPWTTDWISEAGRAKLKAYGLAPAPKHGGDFELVLIESAICPYCESRNTNIRNSFGPTLCRMIYYCNACQQPFEQFKPL